MDTSFSVADWLLIYAATIAAFLLLDGLWLGVVAKKFYASELGSLMADPIRVLPAGIFYLMYAVGLVVLAIQPTDLSVTWLHSALTGAFIGFLAYGTYDMTNLSTVRDWPLRMSLVDWTWGTFLTGTASAVGAYVKHMLLS